MSGGFCVIPEASGHFQLVPDGSRLFRMVPDCSGTAVEPTPCRAQQSLLVPL